MSPKDTQDRSSTGRCSVHRCRSSSTESVSVEEGLGSTGRSEQNLGDHGRRSPETPSQKRPVKKEKEKEEEDTEDVVKKPKIGEDPNPSSHTG